MLLSTRRNFLEIVGLATGGFLLQRTLIGDAVAQSAEPHYLLMVYFDGGWDQLLALDPRNATETQFHRISGALPTSRIEPAYQQVANNDAQVAAVLSSTGGSGVQTRGNLSFGPAIPASLLDHASDLCIVRGINMDTVTHEVGRRYLLTGKFPRGLTANGNSLNTVASAALGAPGDIPNLAIGPETYNADLPSTSSAVVLSTYRDLLTVMQPQTGSALPTASETAVRKFQDADDSCEQHGYDARGLVQSFRSSREFSRQLVQPDKAALFDFKLPAPPALAELYGAFGLATAADLTSMRARAAIAGQALVNGISSVVSLTLADGLDDHFDIFTQHSAPLRTGWDALARLIAFLKSKQATGSAKSVWQCTTLLVFSEFSRTPLINTRDGRDHHVTSSCLLAGPGIKGNTVFGASSDIGMLTQKWDFATGALDNTAGAMIRPSDIHATVLDSMGLPYSHLANQTPKILAPIRK